MSSPRGQGPVDLPVTIEVVLQLLRHSGIAIVFEAVEKISSDTMLWIPESVVAFGMVLLALQFLARFIQALLGLPLEDHRIKAAPVE